MYFQAPWLFSAAAVPRHEDKAIASAHSGAECSKHGQNRNFDNFSCMSRKYMSNSVCYIVAIIFKVCIPNLILYVTSKVGYPILNVIQFQPYTQTSLFIWWSNEQVCMEQKK